MKFGLIQKTTLLLSVALSPVTVLNSASAAQYKNVAAQRCMNVYKQSNTPTGYSIVHLYDCQNNGDLEQDWRRSVGGNTYFLLKLGDAPSVCMNVGAPVNNQKAFPYSCIQGDPGQMLDFEQYPGTTTGRLQFAGKGVCLAAVKLYNVVPYWQNYDIVAARTCNNNNEQKWIRIGND